MTEQASLFDVLRAEGVNPRKWLKRYDDVFSDVEILGETVLDIGAGAGWASFYCAYRGAKHVTAIEPQGDGSRDDMLEQFRRVRSALGFDDVIDLFVGTFEDFKPTRKFNLLVINNAINHFNESACARLHKDPSAKEEYRPLFEKLASLAGHCTSLVVTDCSRRNLWGDLGLKSPVAPTIEWDKHQTPEVWASLLSEHGFELDRIGWLPVLPLGLPGRIMGTNRLGAYCLNSHFRLTMVTEQPRRNSRAP